MHALSGSRPTESQHITYKIPMIYILASSPVSKLYSNQSSNYNIEKHFAIRDLALYNQLTFLRSNKPAVLLLWLRIVALSGSSCLLFSPRKTYFIQQSPPSTLQSYYVLYCSRPFYVRPIFRKRWGATQPDIHSKLSLIILFIKRKNRACILRFFMSSSAFLVFTPFLIA